MKNLREISLGEVNWNQVLKSKKKQSGAVKLNHFFDYKKISLGCCWFDKYGHKVDHCETLGVTNVGGTNINQPHVRVTYRKF